MYAVIVRRHQQPVQRTKAQLAVRVLDELNEDAQRITDARFGRTEMEQGHRNDDLRDVVEQRVKEARAETGEPIHLLDRMMPRVRAPHELERVLRSMNPVDDEVHDEQRHDDADGTREALERRDRAPEEYRRHVPDDVADQVGRRAIDGQREREGQYVELEVLPAIHGMRRPASLGYAEKDYEREQRRD